MKKSLVVLTALCSLFTTAAHANAALNNKPFVGLTLSESYYSAKSNINVGAPQSISFLDKGKWNNAYGIFGGYRWNEFGVQVSAEAMRPIHISTINSNLTSTQHTTNYAVDGLYFYKLSNNLELKNLVGVGLLNTHYNTHDNGVKYTHNNMGVGARVGTGLQYQFTDHVVGEAMVKAQVPGNDTFKNVVGVSVGVGYVF